MKKIEFRRHIRQLLLCCFLLIGCVSAWAQPSSIEVVSDDNFKCRGEIKLRFQVSKLQVNTFDDDLRHITDASLYVQVNGTEKEIMYINEAENGDCQGFRQINALELDDEGVRYIVACERETDLFGMKVKEVNFTGGNTKFIEITLSEASIRATENINFRLTYKWVLERDGDDVNKEETTKNVSKFNPISAVITVPSRDDCNPTQVQVTSTVRVDDVCTNAAGTYLLSVLKDDNEDFTSPDTLVENKSYSAANVGNAFTNLVTEETADNAFYKTEVRYVREGITLASQSSVVGSVQSFAVAPPTMKSVSDDLCQNQVKLLWEYNAEQASQFNIYRSSDSDTYLQLDGTGDYIEVLNSTNISPATTEEMTVEAWVRLDNVGTSRTIVQNGNFFLYLDDGVISGYTGAPSYVVTGGVIPVNSWVHVAMSASWKDGNKFTKLFVNGEEKGSAPGAETPAFVNTIKIGVPDPFPNPSGFLEFEGGLDDVRIWSTAQTTIDPNRNVLGSESDLVMSFNFDEGLPGLDNTSLTKVQDQSSNNFEGQLNGFALTGEISNFNTTFENYQKITEVNGQTLEYLDQQNIESNKLYSYYVTAIKTCQSNTNESLPSDRLEGLSPTNPLSPTGLTITANRIENTIDLNWTDNAFDDTGYQIRRSFGEAAATFNLDPNATSYIDAAVVSCRGYEYDVFAVNVCGLSNEPLQASARLEPDFSTTLSNSATNASKGNFTNRVELTWTPQNNAGNLLDRYRVYRKVLGETDSVQIDVISGNANIYRDETADAGVLYEYTLVGEADCDGDVLRSNVVNTVGFRTATGLVSGQVTYTGGNAVEGVKILVDQADGTQVGKSLTLDGMDDKVTFDSTDWANQSFTIEFWAKRGDSDASTIFAHGNRATATNENLSIGFNASGNFVFDFGNNDLTTTETYNTTDWQHWTCVYDATADKRYIYNNDSLVVFDTLVPAYTGKGIYQLGATLQNSDFYTGQLDEMRIWSIAKDSETVVRDYNRILNGNETGIFATYSFDEGIGYGVYDRSKTGVIFNKQHGQIIGASDLNVAWSTTIPTADQLSLYGLTDANGNYIISSIPYIGVGQSFRVVPQFQTHQFEPSQRNLFIGASSDIFNGTDFSDISSFPVTGSVFYKGTSCPADQIEIQVDGVTAMLNGEKVTTNTNGAFTVDVPIGRHRISLSHISTPPKKSRE